MPRVVKLRFEGVIVLSDSPSTETMKLTRRSEYAILALTYLGRHVGEEWVPLSRIADAQAITSGYSIQGIPLARMRS